MSFLSVCNELYNRFLNDPALSAYVYPDQMVVGANITHPRQHYVIQIEPENEVEPGSPNKIYDDVMEIQYQLAIDCLLNIPASSIDQLILGYTPNGKAFNPGILQFASDVKNVVRKIRETYNVNNGIISGANVSDTFNLTPTNKYISVNFKGVTSIESGLIFCGDSTLSGDDIAANIQASLRSINSYGNTNFSKATCTFDNSTYKFTISAGSIGVDNIVAVSSGATDDCLSLLNFDSGTELIEGRNITKVVFGPTTKDPEYPVRIRTVNCEIFEEVMI